jgi:hypothetical protein
LLLAPTLRTSHDYDKVDANRANGANPGVEDVDVEAGEHAEELTLTQEAVESRNSHAGTATDPVTTRDSGGASTSNPVLQRWKEAMIKSLRHWRRLELGILYQLTKAEI